MQVNTKPLAHAIESATLRLDNVLAKEPLEASDQINVAHEVGCLYSLFLTLAQSVADLQKEHNG